MFQIKLNKRTWLLRITLACSALLLVSFFIIIFRGAIWSPHSIDENTSALELGITTMIRQSGRRVWLTRLDELQRKKLHTISQFVFNQGGCEIEQQICFVKSETSQQGVLIVYVEKKPDILATEVAWQGGFINPKNGAIYDLLGRLYRSNINVNNDSIAKYINVPPVQP